VAPKWKRPLASSKFVANYFMFEIFDIYKLMLLRFFIRLARSCLGKFATYNFPNSNGLHENVFRFPAPFPPSTVDLF